MRTIYLDLIMEEISCQIGKMYSSVGSKPSLILKENEKSVSDVPISMIVGDFGTKKK
jgi:hypothetical protein